MSKLTVGTVVVIAALAAGHAEPVDAAKGLSKKQVRTLVKKEIGRMIAGIQINGVPGPQGPAGPVGPQGPIGPQGSDGPISIDGQAVDIRYARIDTGGQVLSSRGIEQENVVVSEIFEPRQLERFHRMYCLIGLPTPVTGIVSGELDVSNHVTVDEHIYLTSNGACIVRNADTESLVHTGFDVLLLY